MNTSTPTLGAVNLNPQSLIARIPLTMELVADSPNLDAALNATISGAFALKLDQLCVATLLADTDIPASASGQDCATWAGILAAVGAMLAADQDLPRAGIFNSADFIARAGQQAQVYNGTELTSGGAWLGAPPVLAGMADLPTEGMNSGSAILGSFARGFAIAVRQDIRLEMVRWADGGRGAHELVAYGRLGGYVVQPNALFKQLTSV